MPWIPLLLACCCQIQAESLSVGSFSSEGLKNWKRHSFHGETSYNTVTRDGRQVILAESSGSASVLFRELRVDLEKTPWLNWSWRVNNTIPGLDERTKSGDDYPARIYIVTEEGLFPWQSKAVNYVWAGTLPQETRWLSAFTDSSLMIAVRSGDAEVDSWVQEKRNVKTDFQHFLGRPVRYIDVVALMSDTDNSGANVSAEYGDIFFSSE
ncbi:MAG: DUF3047 domain-containing protein [Chromatiaceae bacterium]|nr:DUF3047 domain-containing protein [Chromatiaceae bacterium]MCP5409090.1 DUF3047 domain-containing protein [Chromatiaceae bacterium]MCP5441982.1 DUF3047 domain-containing protein [Chromatiaceae bacterium]